MHVLSLGAQVTQSQLSGCQVRTISGRLSVLP